MLLGPVTSRFNGPTVYNPGFKSLTGRVDERHRRSSSRRAIISFGKCISVIRAISRRGIAAYRASDRFVDTFLFVMSDTQQSANPKPYVVGIAPYRNVNVTFCAADQPNLRASEIHRWKFVQRFGSIASSIRDVTREIAISRYRARARNEPRGITISLSP